MIKYIVSVGYRDFVFDTMTEAGVFADTAIYHMMDDDKYKSSVTIILKEVSEDDTESD